MKNKDKSALENLLDEITPLEQAKTDAKMIIAARIADAMRAKNWKKKDLLAAVGKDYQSVITKWLSGTHNFTVDTLVELEYVLDISLLHLKIEEYVMIAHYHAVVSQKAQPTTGFDYYNQIMILQSCMSAPIEIHSRYKRHSLKSDTFEC